MFFLTLATFRLLLWFRFLICIAKCKKPGSGFIQWRNRIKPLPGFYSMEKQWRNFGGVAALFSGETE